MGGPTCRERGRSSSSPGPSRTRTSRSSWSCTVDQAVVYPREIVKNCILSNSSAIVLVHNHPSGHIRPSDHDIRLTRSLQEVCRLLDIHLHDHVIVGHERQFSFREEGIL